MTTKLPYIICPTCKIVSFNTNDIKYKYCPNCHNYHEYMEITKSLETLKDRLTVNKHYCDYSSCILRYIEHYHIDEYTLTFLNPDKAEKLKNEQKLED